MTTMARTGILEHEIEELDEEIRRLDSEAAAKKQAADDLVAKIRDGGKNPLLDKDLFSQVDEAYKPADDLAEQASQLRQRREAILGRLGRAPASGSDPAGPARRAPRGGVADRMVDALMSSDQYRALRESGAFEAKETRIHTNPVEALTRDELLALLESGRGLRAATADVDAMVDPDLRTFPPVPIPVRPIRVLDLITMTTTDSDQVDYVEETLRTDAAAETPPGVAAPEASYAYENRIAPVRDITHFTPAHKRNLADRGQIRGLLEGRVRYGLENRLETQVVAGDGTGENLTGILNTTGIGSIARNVAGSERRVEAIHRGITVVRLALFMEPDAVGLNPADYEEVVFEKDDNGAYLLGPASQQTSRTVWGFPASITPAFPENTALVGNYRSGAILWLRSGASIAVSDSPGNMFLERRVAILGELRAAFAAWQTQAFCEVTDM
jgi:HK97 family phage major capsid protein